MAFPNKITCSRTGGEYNPLARAIPLGFIIIMVERAVVLVLMVYWYTS